MSLNLTKEIEMFVIADEIAKQKTVANAALRLLNNAGFNDAMVLGGAPRDWLHNNAAKDLDIYIEYSGSLMDMVERIKRALFLQPHELQDVTSTSDYLKNKDNGVLYVFNVVNLAVPVQIIICDRPPLKMLEVFHGSLSQTYAYHNVDSGNLDVRSSSTFVLGKRFLVHFVRKTDDPVYISKVTRKYPQYLLRYEA